MPSDKNSVTVGDHQLFWWWFKVACGAVLIATLVLSSIYNLTPWFDSPTRLSQSLVVIGGLSAIYHYLQLKSVNLNVQQPEVLETRYGLYRFVRHPMYLSDGVSYTGLFLLFPTMATAGVLLFGLLALIRQSKVEDQYLADHFADQFQQWKEQSKMFVPWVY